MEPRGIHRRIQFEITESLRLRFLNGVRTGQPDECWPWVGAMRNGYGAIKHQGRVLGTHVVSFVIAKGQVPDGQIVTHSCDNKPCCNPAHLEAATPTVNVREMFQRLPVRVSRGALSPHAKMNDETVRLIHALHMTRRMGQVRIGKALALNPSTIKTAMIGKSWKHVPKPTREEAIQIVDQWNRQNRKAS